MSKFMGKKHIGEFALAISSPERRRSMDQWERGVGGEWGNGGVLITYFCVKKRMSRDRLI